MKKKWFWDSPDLGILKKMMRVMRITIVLILGLIFTANANSYSQATKLSVKLNNKTIQDVIEYVEENSEFVFLYKNADFDIDKKVDLNLKNATIEQILEVVFAGEDVIYDIYDRQVLIRKETGKPEFPDQEKKTVTGIVTENDGQPLPGATIVVKGTTTGTVTNFEGKFMLEIPATTQTLQFSFVGMKTIDVPVNGRTTFTVILEPDAIGIEEVIAVGYGTQRKADISGAISTVSGADMQKITATSFDKSLQGRSAGVLVQNSSGAPGSSPNIRIRGTGSINSSNEPLYVIDGLLIFPNNASVNGSGDFRIDQLTSNPPNLLASLNPSDIESVKVLKDASATAIYGSRGANGVIVISTKRGKAGRNNFNVDYYSTMRTITKHYPLMNAGEYAQMVNEYNSAIGAPVPFSSSDVSNYIENGGTDWSEEVFRNALINNIQLSANGGSEKVNYYLSTSYLGEEGIVINNDLKRITLRANLDVLLSDKFKIGNSFTSSYTVNNAVPTGGRGPSTGPGVVRSVMSMPPVDPVKNEDGSYFVIPSRSNGEITNPVALAETQEIQYRTFRNLGTFYLQYEFFEGLTGKINLGFDITSREDGTYYPKATTLLGMETGGQARRISSNDINWLTEYLLTYKKIMGDHSFNVVGGYTMQKNRLSRLFAGRENFLTDAFGTTNLSGGAMEIIPQSSLLESSLVSGLGRFNYVYQDKYIFTFTGRYDGSSRFGENNKYAFFPAGAFAWRMGNEDFIKGLEVFDDLKLRSSYGITGNQEIGSYRSLPRLVTVNENFGNVATVGVAPAGNGLPNPDLTWEQTTQFNIGLDATFFQGKLDLNLDYYNRKTEDLLFEFPLPYESGYSSILQNSGSIRNKGVEITSTANLEAGDIKINLSGNLSFNQNEILDLGGADSVIVGNQIRVIGEPLGAWYSYDVEGVWQSNEADLASGFNRVPGDYKYRDVNSDGKYTSDDRTMLGQAQPKYNYGFNADFEYKGFELSIFLQGAGGHLIENRLWYENVVGFTGTGNAFKTVVDSWTPDNASNSVSSMNSTDPFRNKNGITLGNYIEKGDYLRLKNISLAYNLPSSVLEKLKVSKLRIYLSAENLMTITGYSGMDPEIIGTENSNYPFSKSFRMGVNLGF